MPILLISTGAIILIAVGTGVGLAGGFLLGKLREMKKRRRDLKKIRMEEKELQQEERKMRREEAKQHELIRKYEAKRNAGNEVEV